jgi:16S rRNA (cytosine1402-N4)-methyltransferase
MGSEGLEHVHLPVMAGEMMMLIEPKAGGVYVDATVGLGGHAEKMLEGIGPSGRLVCIDRDEEALKAASQRLKHDKRCVFKKGRFSSLAGIVRSEGFTGVDGVFFDFGVSMMQFKDKKRGFGFSSDEPLDMRMDISAGPTAADIVNKYPERELERILREFGEERYSAKIAKAISGARKRHPIRTCRELSGLVYSICGKRGRRHPATRTFQALRIAVNDELREIEEGLKAAAEVLKRGGRLVAVSYHSLEDRIVKNFIRTSAKEGSMRALTKKPLSPSLEEIRKNPSARSAKMRGAERL